MPPDVIEDLFAAGAVEWRLDVGDPGATHDASVARADLPPFDGPPVHASGHHEWGAAAAADEQERETPLEGPGLAPFGQASESEDPAAASEP
jgi:hypothetical protein